MLKSRRGSELRNENPARRRNPWKFSPGLEGLEDRWMFALAGDANLDAAFGSADLIAAFQAGKFEMDVEAAWAEGDWNGDQRFNTSDLIAAFTIGRYELDAPYSGQYDVLREKYVSINEGRDVLGEFIREGTIEKGSGLYAQFEAGAIYWSSATGAHIVQGAIWNRFSEMGWEQSVLGYPISDETMTSDGLGRYNSFQGGLIIWSPETGAHEVYGEILKKWGSLGWERSFLAYPVTHQSVAPDGIGQFSHFQGGSIYWSPDTGAHEVHGAIRDQWSSLGWEQSVLGYPISDETVTSDGVGRYNAFQGGLIVWSAETGANEVHGAILDKWGSLGWERSFLGYPLTNESTTPDGVGRFSHFQGGSIYWSPNTGAHEVHGAIRDQWSSLGWEQSVLGYPISDETVTSDGVGRYNAFQGGLIVWSAETGANEVHGAILDKWGSLGWERSFLGYPLTNESTTPDGVGRFSHFQGGSIYWSPNTGAHEVHGAILAKWSSVGWEQSWLGYPVSDEHDGLDPSERISDFQFGKIVWNPATGASIIESNECPGCIVLNQVVTTPGITALGGWVETTLRPDGHIRFKGHMHDSGLESYSFRVRAIMLSDAPYAIAFQKSGSVAGTIGAGSRDFDWDETTFNPSLAAHFGEIGRGTRLEVYEDHEGAITGSLETMASVALRWIVGSAVLTPGVAMVVFAGTELGSLVSTGSLVPGARVIAGTLWMAGPAGTLYGFVAEGVASVGARSRELTQDEYDWANAEVFGGTLPPKDQIVLTDTIGAGNRAFVFPGADGKVSVNIGPNAFDDPRNYRGTDGKRVYGEILIHELVHVWQVYHATSSLTFIADAFAARICEATGDNPYTVGLAGPPYGDFSLEAQAQLVSNWFRDGKQITSPYYRYVEGNIRLGRPN